MGEATVGRNFDVNIGRAAWEVCSATWNLWSRSSSKCYLRIQSVPQREHHTSPLQRSTG